MVFCVLYLAFSILYLSDPGVPGVQSMGPVFCHLPSADLTDVTLDVNHPVDLVVKFQTNASSAIWWQNLQPM